MSIDLFEFETPTPFLVGEAVLYNGNFIAERASGYYNGNKTSWHVSEVVWFYGIFEGINSWDNTSLEWITNVCKQEFEIHPSVRSGKVNGVEAQFVAIKKLAVCNKREAKKLIESLHRDRGYVLMYSKTKDERTLKHKIQELTLKNNLTQ